MTQLNDECKASMQPGGMLSRRSFSRAALGFGLGACAALAGGAFSLTGCQSNAFSQGRLRKGTDMIGREIAIPQDISSVFCSNPIGTVDLYLLAPDLLAGWNFRPAGANRTFIKNEYLELPSLGVWMGAGATPNDEEIVAQDPDVILCYWTADQVGVDMADSVQDETGVCTLGIDYDLRSAPEMFRFVGGLLGREERAEELASYCEEKLAYIRKVVAAIPEGERKSVYLAQGTGGLMTDPVGSMHVTDALELLQTRNVADLPGTQGKGMGMPTVNLEQIITWNPDAVLVSEYSMSDAESSDLYDEIRTDANWRNVPCVADGQVFRIPQQPFSWFARPPSAVRVLGCLLVLSVLYPDYAGDIDMVAETRSAYQLFYDYELSDEQLEGILRTAGVPL